MNTKDSIEQLRRLLDTNGPGAVVNVRGLEQSLMPCWLHFAGALEESMTSNKLKGRVENAEWTPPILTFSIERHGRTVQTSKRADVHTYAVDLDACVAQIIQKSWRQVVAMARPLDVQPLARSVASSIIAGNDEDDRITFLRTGGVRVNVSCAVPRTVKQTTAGRRKRFRQALRDILAPVGWSELRANYWYRNK